MSQPKAASKSEPRRPTEAESFCFHHLGSVVLAQLQSNFIAAEIVGCSCLAPRDRDGRRVTVWHHLILGELEGPDLRRMDTTIATRANKPENEDPAIVGARRTRGRGGAPAPAYNCAPSASQIRTELLTSMGRRRPWMSYRRSSWRSLW